MIRSSGGTLAEQSTTRQTTPQMKQTIHPSEGPPRSHPREEEQWSISGPLLFLPPIRATYGTTAAIGAWHRGIRDRSGSIGVKIVIASVNNMLIGRFRQPETPLFHGSIKCGHMPSQSKAKPMRHAKNGSGSLIPSSPFLDKRARFGIFMVPIRFVLLGFSPPFPPSHCSLPDQAGQGIRNEGREARQQKNKI